VESVDQDGDSIPGYYAVLFAANGSQLATGFTTYTFASVTTGTSYQIQLDSYGSCTFENWQGTGGSVNPLTFTQGDGPMTLVGVYDCTSSSSLAQSPSIGIMMSAIMSQIGIPIGFVVVALGSLAIVRTIQTVRRGAWYGFLKTLLVENSEGVMKTRRA
jgi:hypothetical protein